MTTDQWLNWKFEGEIGEVLTDLNLEWPVNAWMGVSVESSAYVHRIDDLRRVPARTRFLSLEPLLSALPDLTSWTDVKKAIEARGREEWVNIVADLYRLSKANQSFLHARYSVGEDRLKPYKKIINDSIIPDMYSNKPLRIARAKAAVADYKKAVGDPMGEVELLVYFAEVGGRVATSYGDMDGPFYSAVVNAYREAIKIVKNLPEASQTLFKEWLEAIMLASRNGAGGYQDSIIELFADAFNQDEDGAEAE